MAFDGERPSFGRLQHRIHITKPAEVTRVAAEIPVVYVVFDPLHLDGEDLTALPYLERRRQLIDVVPDGLAWRVPVRHIGGGGEPLEVARELQLEGIMWLKAATAPTAPTGVAPSG